MKHYFTLLMLSLIHIFAQKLAPANPKVFFSGGLAQFDVIKQSLANHLGVKEVATDSLCQYTGAIAVSYTHLGRYL